MIKNVAISLSLANLCLINMWHNLLYRTPTSSSNDYFLKSSPYRLTAAAAILDVLLLGAALLPVMILAGRRRSSGKALARPVVLGMLFFPIYYILLFGLSLYVGSSLSANDAALSFIVAFLTLPILYFLWYRKPQVGESVRNVLLVLSPFVLLTFSHAAWHLALGEGAFVDKPLAPLIQNTPASPRVLWFIFDEMDQRQTFEGRLPDVKLPVIDRLRDESLYANNAYPPGSWTIRSLPALFIGKRISKAEPLSSDELAITFCGTDRAVRWSHEPNVFSGARAMGFNTAVIGGYHPYCRIINKNVSSCFWQPWDPFESGPKPTLVGTMAEQFAIGLGVFDPSHRLLSRRSEEIRAEVLKGVLHEVLYHAGIYTNILEESRKVIADPNFGLIVVHWPIPHPPSIYDRSTQRLRDSQVNVTDTSYADNLVLVDRTLGLIRRDLEASGRWDSITLIVSSDHWLRKSLWRYEGEVDHRIPFMLKLAGQKKGVTYEKPFNTVLTHDLVLAIMKGEITSTDGAVTWLDRNRTATEGTCGYQDDVE